MEVLTSTQPLGTVDIWRMNQHIKDRSLSSLSLILKFLRDLRIFFNFKVYLKGEAITGTHMACSRVERIRWEKVEEDSVYMGRQSLPLCQSSYDLGKGSGFLNNPPGLQ